jgi:hypothetical protein
MLFDVQLPRRGPTVTFGGGTTVRRVKEFHSVERKKCCNLVCKRNRRVVWETTSRIANALCFLAGCVFRIEGEGTDTGVGISVRIVYDRLTLDGPRRSTLRFTLLKNGCRRQFVDQFHSDEQDQQVIHLPHDGNERRIN